MATRLLVATANAGKLAELRDLLGDTGIEVEGQQAHGIDSIEETGQSFVENALQKARHASRLSGLPALADDSGLIVDALGDEPGLHSARYAGAAADSEANISLLLTRLRDVPSDRRGAAFHCVLVLVRNADDPRPLLAEGRWRGRILDAPRGTGGFGYDPVFEVPGMGCSAAELPPEVKNRLSHRARALAELRERLREQPL